MARRCELTGKESRPEIWSATPTTRRSGCFAPIFRRSRWRAKVPRHALRLKVAMSTLRTLDRRGGLDAFLLAAKDDGASALGRCRLKRQIRKSEAGKPARSLSRQSGSPLTMLRWPLWKARCMLADSCVPNGWTDDGDSRRRRGAFRGAASEQPARQEHRRPGPTRHRSVLRAIAAIRPRRSPRSAPLRRADCGAACRSLGLLALFALAYLYRGETARRARPSVRAARALAAAGGARQCPSRSSVVHLTNRRYRPAIAVAQIAIAWIASPWWRPRSIWRVALARCRVMPISIGAWCSRCARRLRSRSSSAVIAFDATRSRRWWSGPALRVRSGRRCCSA